jgi:hypothetical protein
MKCQNVSPKYGKCKNKAEHKVDGIWLCAPHKKCYEMNKAQVIQANVNVLKLKVTGQMEI